MAPDQSCIATPSYTIDSGEPHAQIFTVGRSGRLVAVRLALGCNEAEEVLLEIQSVSGMLPNGTVLHSQTVRGVYRPADINENPLVALTSPIPVGGGQRIALVVRFRGPSRCVLFAANDCYAGGYGAKFTGDPPVWQPDRNWDLGFRTYVAD